MPTISGFGGVHQDLPPKLLDDIWAFCDPFLQVCDDLEGLLTENRIFEQRNVGIAEVKLADALQRGERPRRANRRHSPKPPVGRRLRENQPL